MFGRYNAFKDVPQAMHGKLQQGIALLVLCAFSLSPFWTGETRHGQPLDGVDHHSELLVVEAQPDRIPGEAGWDAGADESEEALAARRLAGPRAPGHFHLQSPAAYRSFVHTPPTKPPISAPGQA